MKGVCIKGFGIGAGKRFGGWQYWDIKGVNRLSPFLTIWKIIDIITATMLFNV
jgi:hypothetical protein